MLQLGVVTSTFVCDFVVEQDASIVLFSSNGWGVCCMK